MAAVLEPGCIASDKKTEGWKLPEALLPKVLGPLPEALPTLPWPTGAACCPPSPEFREKAAN